MKTLSWCAALAAVWVGMALAEPAPSDGEPRPEARSAPLNTVQAVDGTVAIESCVSDARITFGRTDLRALLDDDERRAVHAQLMQRYPAAQRVGVEPTHLVLWQPSEGPWLYVALLQHPQHPEQWCFTASFVAGTVERTSVLLQKYFALRSA